MFVTALHHNKLVYECILKHMILLFKQPLSLPAKTFEVGYKVEVTNPDDPKVAHIATIVQVHGYRIRLRLDGFDSSSDIWRQAYSPDIHPVGYSDTSGQKLLSPLGKFLPLQVKWSHCTLYSGWSVMNVSFCRPLQ